MRWTTIPAALRDEANNLFYRIPGLNPRLERWFDYHVIRHRYHRAFGEYPNLESPRTFSEKVIYKRLYDRRPLLTRVADKVRVRDFVAERIGAECLPEMMAVNRDPAAIDWASLPARFVAKANHGSGYNIVVNGRTAFDRLATVSRLRGWIDSSFYTYSREWCYRDIEPLAFIEEFLKGEDGGLPDDWKFFVFGGKARYVQVDTGRDKAHRHSFYRMDRSRVRVRSFVDDRDRDPVWPANFETMVRFAETLGAEFDFIRADFYNIDGRIVFGELTNYPHAGLMPFEPASVDLEFGSHWALLERY